MIPTHQDDIISVQQVMTNQQPVELTLTQGRIEQALDGPVATCAPQ
jgi:hypothetical protein